MKKSTQLMEDRALVVKEYEDLVKKAETENRDFTPEEIRKESDLQARIDALSNDINAAIKREQYLAQAAGTRATQLSKQDKKDLRSFSLLRAIRGYMNGNLDGVELEMHQEARREMSEVVGKDLLGLGVPRIIMHGERGYVPKAERRAVTATGGDPAGSQGGYMIATEVAPLISELVDKMVLADLGTSFWTNLVGNINLPKAGAVTASWGTEVYEAGDAAPAFTKDSMTPHRLYAAVPISSQLIRQTSETVESYIVQLIFQGIAKAVQVAAINGAGSNDPTGLLNVSGINSVIGGDNGAAPDWTHIVKLQSEVAADNADVGSLAYLTNPKVRGVLKTKETASGNGIFVWPMIGDTLNGYKAGVTTSVPSNLTKGSSSGVCSAIIFGNFNDLVVGQWGGMDLVIDPYTKAKSDQVEIVANTFWDVVLQHATSFAAMKDALTS